MVVRLLAAIPSIADVGQEEMSALCTMRLWALTARSRCCSMRALAQRLGSPRAAAHFHLLMEEIGTAWPDPFCVSPPCSSRLTPDEACFTEMMRLSAWSDRPGFDRLLADLLPADERERLYLSASMVTGFTARC